MHSDILLLTSAIDCNKDCPYLSLKDHKERLFQTLCCLIEWAQLPHISHIILCDNTNIDYDFRPIEEYLKKHGIIFELLTFQGDFSKVQKYGKGYGEGEIIKYALANSKYLREDDASFYKVTSRLFVNNFSIIQKHLTDVPNAFPPSKEKCYIYLAKKIKRKLFGQTKHCKSIQTQFYKCNVSFYKQYLLHAFEDVRDHEGLYMEHVFFGALCRKNVFILKPLPIYTGVSGTSGKIYSHDYSKNTKDLALTFLANINDSKNRLATSL